MTHQITLLRFPTEHSYRETASGAVFPGESSVSRLDPPKGNTLAFYLLVISWTNKIKFITPKKGLKSNITPERRRPLSQAVISSAGSFISSRNYLLQSKTAHRLCSLSPKTSLKFQTWTFCMALVYLCVNKFICFDFIFFQFVILQITAHLLYRSGSLNFREGRAERFSFCPYII